MPLNADKPHLWKADMAQAVAAFNAWYVSEAPQAYQQARLESAAHVESALSATSNLTNIDARALRQSPASLSMLRMMTTPPLSRERLSGLAQVSTTFIAAMERDDHIPPQLLDDVVESDLGRIGATLTRLADRDIFPWLEQRHHLTESQVHRAAMIVADRLCVAAAEGILRDAQSRAQRAAVTRWLERRGYTETENGPRLGLNHLRPGRFATGIVAPILGSATATQRMVPIDVAVMPAHARPGDLPILLVVRAASDVSRARRQRAEDAATMTALRSTYGNGIRFLVVLRGYVDSSDLGHLAAEGIDWVWDHRVDDLAHVDDLQPVRGPEPSGTRPAPTTAPAPWASRSEVRS